jgi:hypothetical protein
MGVGCGRACSKLRGAAEIGKQLVLPRRHGCRGCELGAAVLAALGAAAAQGSAQDSDQHAGAPERSLSKGARENLEGREWAAAGGSASLRELVVVCRNCAKVPISDLEGALFSGILEFINYLRHQTVSFPLRIQRKVDSVFQRELYHDDGNILFFHVLIKHTNTHTQLEHPPSRYVISF